MKVIIADTSCLIIYDKINKLEILQRTFTELIVTREVSEEYGELPNWIKIRDLEDEEQYLKLAENLGKGEASSIALALEIKSSLLILDEKKGRKIAEELGIEIIGSLGVLIKAKDKGIIKSIKEVLALIEKTNFRISEAIKKKLLNEAGE
jgi:predicted nucleic acid-binding protein